jgi:hypothetical protein
LLETRLVIERLAAEITTVPLAETPCATNTGGLRPPRHAVLRCNPLVPTTAHPSQKDAH